MTSSLPLGYNDLYEIGKSPTGQLVKPSCYKAPFDDAINALSMSKMRDLSVLCCAYKSQAGLYDYQQGLTETAFWRESPKMTALRGIEEEIGFAVNPDAIKHHGETTIKRRTGQQTWNTYSVPIDQCRPLRCQDLTPLGGPENNDKTCKVGVLVYGPKADLVKMLTERTCKQHSPDAIAGFVIIPLSLL